MSDQAWYDSFDQTVIDALARHGYPDLPARGIGGPPGEIISGYIRNAETGQFVRGDLRNRVCYLDDVEIDGHEYSDLDFGSTICIHCNSQ